MVNERVVDIEEQSLSIREANAQLSLFFTLTASVARMWLLCVLLVFVLFTSTLVVVPAHSAVTR